MPKKTGRGKAAGDGSCCESGCCDDTCSCRGSAGGCRVEAVVTLDERGQMVLPKGVRETAGFGAGQKIAVVTWSEGGSVCCVSLQRADDLAESVQRRYGPLLLSARSGK